MPQLSITRRTRSTPFTQRLEAHGVNSYTVYNRMLLPTSDRVIEDYQHLKTAVQVWDVSCERQVAVVGSDAQRLLDMLTPRDLSKMKEHQCYYIPVIDENAGILNDPVLIKHNSEHFWLSIADSDLRLWVQGIAIALRLDVRVYEPAVFPLAVQGPLAETLMQRVFGQEVCGLKFFRAGRFLFDGHALLISRSGYSKQGGFEIYVEHPDDLQSYAERLWDSLFAAGKDLEVRAAGPNYIERIEAGLLSYGNDMTQENTPYECGMSELCHQSRFAECIGGAALRKKQNEGNPLRLHSIALEGKPLQPCRQLWPIMHSETQVGQITSAAWSPDFATNVALGMIRQDAIEKAQHLRVCTPEGQRQLELRQSSFI